MGTCPPSPAADRLTREECWHVYYGDVHAGTIAIRTGPTMFARIGIMRALNRNVERVLDPSRKDHHWGKRKLARDR
jgi:hypothetical protein